MGVARFFGTNGIRGIFPEDLTLEFIHDMALAVGTYFARGPVLLGYDGRQSSPAICRIVGAALNSIGIDCNVAGIVPTPCLEYAVKTMGYAGGIMITASHNPPRYTGIKPVAPDGVEIPREDELIVEDIYLQRRWPASPQRWGVTGQEERAIRTYLDGIVSQVDSEAIRSRGIRVALDLGNGAQSAAAPRLAEMLGCQTVLVNEEIDGEFPGRGSEPTPDNLCGLSEAVRESGADFGIAFDGDGDRSVFCDEQGDILTGDRSALVLMRHVLERNPGSPVATCLNSGSAAEEVAQEFGSEVIRTRVGSVEVSRRMVRTGALVGFEENGGFMYGAHNQVRDGAMALALMLERLASSRESLSEAVGGLPPSFTTKGRVSCQPEAAPGVIAALSEEFPDADTSDGIRITLGPRRWVMIRPSGTEPIIRVYAEADGREALGDLMSEYLEKTESLVSR